MKLIITKQEVLEKFGLPAGTEIELASDSETIVNQSATRTIIVDFPEKTMKEICEETGNKAGSGKLLYDTAWYENEDFFTKEKTRKGKRIVSLELKHLGKSWNEIVAMGMENEMLTPAEVTYLLAYVPEYREVLKGWKYTWTSGRASDGSFVVVGLFDSDGAIVLSNRPDDSSSFIGVSFSKIVL